MKKEKLYTEAEVLEVVNHVLEVKGHLAPITSNEKLAHAFFLKTIAPKLNITNVKFEPIGYEDAKSAKFKIQPLDETSPEEATEKVLVTLRSTFPALKKGDDRSFFLSKLRSGERVPNHPETGNLVATITPEGIVKASWIPK